jgi:hypothetical protein
LADLASFTTSSIETSAIDGDASPNDRAHTLAVANNFQDVMESPFV